jgi:hypothetical protein
MPTDKNTTEQIERFLSGEMSGAERENFEAALKQDPALAESLGLHRDLQTSLGNRERRQLLDALSEVVAQEEEKPWGLTVQWRSYARIAAAATILLAAAVGFWFYSQPAEDTPALVESPVNQTKPELVSPQPAPVFESPSTSPRDPEPLASADRRAFTPNRSLDPLVGTMVRGGGANLSVSAPQNDAILPIRNGKVVFNLEGQASDRLTLALQIFNNKEADFAAGKTMYTADVPVNADAFVLKETMSLKPGVYYAVLSAPDDGEPLLVLRFYAGGK